MKQLSLYLLLCLLAAPPASADDAPPADDNAPSIAQPALTKLDTSRLETLYDEGTKHYDLGEWDAAIAAFREAYGLMPDPSFLYNIAQAYRQKHACRDATAAYKAYLRNAPDQDRPKVEQFIHELEPCVHAEEENARRLLPPPAAPPPIPAGPSWPRKLRWGGYAAGGLGAAFVGAGILFSLRARSASDDFERACASVCQAGPDLERIEQRGRDADRNALIFYAVGGTAIASGAMLWMLGHRYERLTVTPTGGGAMATARWSW